MKCIPEDIYLFDKLISITSKFSSFFLIILNNDNNLLELNDRPILCRSIYRWMNDGVVDNIQKHDLNSVIVNWKY